MIISKELEWMRDYIESVNHLLPNLKYLKRLSSRKAHKDKIQRAHGVCTKYLTTKMFTISLYVTYTEEVSYKPLKIKIKHYNTIDLLRYLAHELAHIQHYDEHTPDHCYLESSILIIFMTKLKADGYISEEDEMKRLR